MNKIDNKILAKKTTTFLFIVAVFFVGCNKQPGNKNDEQFCSYANVENIDKTIPIINDYLYDLSTGLNIEQHLQELVAWLQTYPCITDAIVFNKTQNMSQIEVLFDESGTTKSLIMDVSMGKPLKVTGYRELKHLLGCNVENPLTDLPWLKEMIDTYKDFRNAKIYMTTYRDGTIFMEIGTFGSADNRFYNCTGEEICTNSSVIRCDPELNIDRENMKPIWDSALLQPCVFDDPLMDLPWLVQWVDDRRRRVEEGWWKYARLYQCTFREGNIDPTIVRTGFLEESNITSGYTLLYCSGGASVCAIRSPGYNCTDENVDVDVENKILIIEIK